MNFVPWGGPSARAASAVQVDLNDVFLPLLPSMAVGLLAVLVIAWMFGRSERTRLAALANSSFMAPRDPGIAQPVALREPADNTTRRPHLFWFNLMLTVTLLAGMVLSVAPLPVLMMAAFAIAVTINYPQLKDQRQRVASHAESVVNIVVLIFAAGRSPAF